MHDNYIIRVMNCKDLDEAYQIEKDSYSLPWSYENFQNSLSYSQSNYVITKSCGKILGFLMLMVVADECQVLNIAISKLYRNRGLGLMLLNHAISCLPKHVKKIWLEVMKSNIVAQNLYKKLFFVMVGKRKNYYKTTTGYEDALIFMREKN
ncbi:MAG: ribosomal protein S18-alanine N-acetyltransferase [Legionellales bacterium]|nr:ribosomal protein S18-alanine N-acetyltransferase [Legionellales bacterium]